MKKVSLIVPTYCPGEGIHHVIDSLDAQTMPQDEFEVVLVDDGSPDDTVERLQGFAADRPNLRVIPIEHSGWPSRPRNVGLDAAAGEFVVFMDHDDRIYPGGLRAVYDFAVAEQADVVCGREIRTNQLFAYWGSFQRDVSASEPKVPARLSPWTTHKLFRRSMLQDHGIRFREGPRSLWEDVMVDMEVYAATDRIAVLASQPFYQWVSVPGQNASSTYGRDLEAFVASIETMYEHLDTAGVDHDFSLFMKTHQLNLRILSYLAGPRCLQRSGGDLDRSLDLAHDFVRRLVPDEVAHRLPEAGRARLHLVAEGAKDLVVSLAEHDHLAALTPQQTEVAWQAGGRLQVVTSTRWTHGEQGDDLLLREHDGRILRAVPAALEAALPVDALDVTEALRKQPEADLVVTHHSSRVGWRVPGEAARVCRDAGEGLRRHEVDLRAPFDHRTAAMGSRVENGVWVVSLRGAFAGFGSHAPLPYDGPRRVALVDGTLVQAYADRRGRLRIDVDVPGKSPFDVTSPDLVGTTLRHDGGGAELQVPVSDLFVDGPADLPLELRLRPLDSSGPVVRRDARLVADARGARVVARLDMADLARGRHRVVLDDSALTGRERRPVVTPLVVFVGRRWRSPRARLKMEAVPDDAARRWESPT
jgi:glycosyltransferase involved in cell wall biosynthesis